MTRYWLKIALGALLIFAVGMAVWLGVKKGVRTVHTVLETAEPITVPLKFIDFRVDGARLGKLERITLHRDTPNRIASVDIEVRVDSLAMADRLRKCSLRIDDVQHLNENTTFVCASPDSPAPSDAYESFGVVHVAGTDLAIPLLLPAAAVRDLRNRGWSGADSMAPPASPTSPAAPRPAGTAGAAPAAPSP